MTPEQFVEKWGDFIIRELCSNAGRLEIKPLNSPVLPGDTQVELTLGGEGVRRTYSDAMRALSSDHAFKKDIKELNKGGTHFIVPIIRRPSGAFDPKLMQ